MGRGGPGPGCESPRSPSAIRPRSARARFSILPTELADLKNGPVADTDGGPALHRPKSHDGPQPKRGICALSLRFCPLLRRGEFANRRARPSADSCGIGIARLPARRETRVPASRSRAWTPRKREATNDANISSGLECRRSVAPVVERDLPVVERDLRRWRGGGPGRPAVVAPGPRPSNLGDFIRDEEAARALGKALFWDMQVGSDGVQACATCHFRAGADSRTKNQVSPGLLRVLFQPDDRPAGRGPEPRPRLRRAGPELRPEQGRLPLPSAREPPGP